MPWDRIRWSASTTQNVVVNRGDYIVQCTDGLWGFVSEGEVLEIVIKHQPEEACKEVIDLADAGLWAKAMIT